MYCIQARKERRRERPEAQGEDKLLLHCIKARKERRREAYGALACASPVKS